MPTKQCPPAWGSADHPEKSFISSCHGNTGVAQLEVRLKTQQSSIYLTLSLQYRWPVAWGSTCMTKFYLTLIPHYRCPAAWSFTDLADKDDLSHLTTTVQVFCRRADTSWQKLLGVMMLEGASIRRRAMFWPSASMAPRCHALFTLSLTQNKKKPKLWCVNRVDWSSEKKTPIKQSSDVWTELTGLLLNPKV